MTVSDWIAVGGLAMILAPIGIRMIMKMTRLIDSIDHLDGTIKTAIRDHERRLHPGHHNHRHHRAG
jgi:hypothetical protein